MFLLNSFWLMPAFMLKKIVLGNFAKGPVDSKMADAIDFMVDRVSRRVFLGYVTSSVSLYCYVFAGTRKDLEYFMYLGYIKSIEDVVSQYFQDI